MTVAATDAQAERLARWRQARRVLLIRLDNLGDVLMTTPALAAVRESLPEAQLTLLAAPSMTALAPHLPEVDRIVGFHAPWMKAGAAALAADDPPLGRDERQAVAQWADEGYDAAIIFTVCTQSVFPAATMCRLAGIPRVLGHARERAYGLLSDEIPDRDEVGDGMRHEVRRQLDLVGAVGLRTRDERLRFRVLESDRDAVRQSLVAAGVGPRQPFVIVHPGASAPSRRYPADRLGESAGLLRQAMAWRAGGTAEAPPAIVVCGGPGEESLVQDTVQALAAADLPASAAQGRVLSPRLSSVGELAALIAEADLLIGNNSGPVHLAAAVGTPVVDLYALTNPQHTPWQVPSRVLFRDVPCRFCQKSLCPEGHHRCLSGVSPREVAAAAIALMPARFPAMPQALQPAVGAAA